jgi:F-type H+-transporting ATPase subunit delta
MMGRVLAEIRTAVPLDDAMRGQITEQLGNILNKQVRLSETVDPDLIGGIVVRIGDSVFDNSVSTRLDQVARRARDGFSSQLLQKFSTFTSE